MRFKLDEIPTTQFLLQQMLAVTVQTTIAELGPIPDQYGDRVRSIMACTDEKDVIFLGIAMDQCRDEKGWEPLIQRLNLIDEEKF